MPSLLMPNIAGSFQQGFQSGQTQRANRLLGLGLGGDQNALSQAAVIDPGDAMRVQRYQQVQQATQAQAQQDQQTAAMKKIGGAARYMLAALQTKDPNQIEGAYQAVRPYLAELGQAQGKIPPDHWDPAMEQAVYQAAAMTAQAFPDDAKLYNLAPGGQLVNGTGATVASAPFKPAQFQYKSVPNGAGTAAGVFDPNTGQLRPATAAPAAAPAQQPAPAPLQSNTVGTHGERVNFVFAPGTDPAIINATKAGAAASGVIPQNATFGVGVKQQSAPAGYRYTADGNLEVIPGGPADKSGSQMIGDPNLTGNAYLASVQDQGLRNMIQAISEGRMQVPRIYRSSKGGELGPTEIAAAVNQYDPTFNAADYNARAKTYSGFTSGKEAQQVNALNTVAQHLQALAQDAAALNNTSMPALNGLVNTVESKGFGDPRVTRFNLARDAVSKELERVWRGTGGSETGIQQWQQDLSSSGSPAQLQNAISQLTELVNGKLQALKNQYVQGMGRSRNSLQLLSPQTQAVFSRLDPENTQGYANAATATPPVGAAPQSQTPQPRAVNPQTGEAVVWNGSAWVPEQ